MNLIQCQNFGLYAADECLKMLDAELMRGLRFPKTSNCEAAEDRPLTGHDPASPRPIVSNRRKLEVRFW